MNEIAIGIDLGTTNTVAAYFVNDQIRILEPCEGNRMTPSFTMYEEGGRYIIGYIAKRAAVRRPEMCIYEVKRLIGRKFDDPNIQKSLKYFSFDVGADSRNEPVISIGRAAEKITTTPREQSSLVLKKVAQDIERKFGKVFTKAVITVPAYFNIVQREATLEAAKEAGFQVLKLLNEPTAAALDYLYENPSETGDHFMVFDLGGGTFDVAILEKKTSNIDVVCVDGDSSLGGHDIDNLIIDYALKHLNTKYGYSPVDDKLQMARLKWVCESAKVDLSVLQKTKIILEGYVPGHEQVSISLNRNKLEDLASTLFEKMMKTVDSALKSSNLSKDDIKCVILVGGSTRINKISLILNDYFGRNILSNFVNPDECVARGAALQAAMIMYPEGKYNDIKIIDVVPLSIGIQDFMKYMGIIIKRNTPIPHTVEVNRVNLHHNQTSASFDLFEGERLNCIYNRPLGQLVLTNITPSAPCQCKFVVKLQIDQNGILQITAKENLKDVEKVLKIDYSKSRQSESKVNNAVQDAEANAVEDGKFAMFAEKAGYLMEYCIYVKYNLDELKLKAQHETTYELCEGIINQVEQLQMDDMDKIERLVEQVELETENLAQKFNFRDKPVKLFSTRPTSFIHSAVKQLPSRIANFCEVDTVGDGESRSEKADAPFVQLRKAGASEIPQNRSSSEYESVDLTENPTTKVTNGIKPAIVKDSTAESSAQSSKPKNSAPKVPIKPKRNKIPLSSSESSTTDSDNADERSMMANEITRDASSSKPDDKASDLAQSSDSDAVEIRVRPKQTEQERKTPINRLTRDRFSFLKKD